MRVLVGLEVSSGTRLVGSSIHGVAPNVMDDEGTSVGVTLGAATDSWGASLDRVGGSE